MLELRKFTPYIHAFYPNLNPASRHTKNNTIEIAPSKLKLKPGNKTKREPRIKPIIAK
ncbi:MAG: hypothetical protein FWC68_05090 [Oscillospiraceae bacterium]|nr:hypothetical protein [Oscillospiraceae bacterium]